MRIKDECTALKATPNIFAATRPGRLNVLCVHYLFLVFHFVIISLCGAAPPTQHKRVVYICNSVIVIYIFNILLEVSVTGKYGYSRFGGERTVL